MRSWILLAVFVLLVVACGSSTPPPSSPPPPQTEPGLACGVRLFATPACQAALDEVCCPMGRECAKDPGCVRLSQCLISCKGRGDNCANGCGSQARYDYCNGACQGRGGDCTTICAQRGSPAEPMVKYAIIADCSKGVRYPPGVRCDDGT